MKRDKNENSNLTILAFFSIKKGPFKSFFKHTILNNYHYYYGYDLWVRHTLKKAMLDSQKASHTN